MKNVSTLRPIKYYNDQILRCSARSQALWGIQGHSEVLMFIISQQAVMSSWPPVITQKKGSQT